MGYFAYKRRSCTVAAFDNHSFYYTEAGVGKRNIIHGRWGRKRYGMPEHYGWERE